MKVFLKTCVFIFGVLFFTGGACPSNDTTASNKVAQSEIYQSYSVEQNGANYDVKAFFRIGGKTGTTLALSAPSTVSFNGQKMEEHLNTSSGTFYTATVPATASNATFAFTDRTSKVYTNKVDLERTSLTAAKLRTNGATPVAIPLSRPAADSAGFNLNLNGTTIFVSSSPNNASEAFYDRAKNAVVIMPAAWKKIPGGNVAIALEVNNSVPTQQGTALGGDIAFRYGSAPVNVAFIKDRSKPVRRTPNANATAKTNSMVNKPTP